MASLLPLLLGERPVSIYDQNFGLGALDAGVLAPNTIRIGYYRPWRHQAGRESGVSKMQSAKDGFKVSLDVQQFRPDEISVKTVDNFVVIEGKHGEREDEHGFVCRQFTRRYAIPEDVDSKQIISSLSSDCVLTISAPKKVTDKPNVRVIPIVRTQQPAQGQGDAKQENAEQ